ncbi:MAG: NUDIX domain-containing protein [Pirellulaceae bacterium]
MTLAIASRLQQSPLANVNPKHPAMSLPVEESFKFCPRCGNASTKPGAVPFSCGDCGYTNYFGPVCAVGGIVVNERGEMLFIRRARDPGKGKWGLPGGFVDTGETGEQAVVREVREETGLEVTRAEYMMSHPNQYDYKNVICPVLDLFYLVDVVSHDAITLAEDEVEHSEWSRPTDEHLENMAFHSNRLALEHWMKLSAE